MNKGYNLTEGGRGNWGWKPNRITREKISIGRRGKMKGDRNSSKREEVKIKLKKNNIWNNPDLTKLQNKLYILLSYRMKKNNPMKNKKVRKKASETKIKNGIAKGKNNPNYKHGNYCKDKVHYCIDPECVNTVHKKDNRCHSCAAKEIANRPGINKKRSESLKNTLLCGLM